MADEELNLDMDEEQGGGKGKLFIIIGIVLVLIIGGVVAFLFMGGDEEPPAEGEEAGETEKPVKQEKTSEGEKGPAIYVPVKDPFILNLRAAKRDRYLQVNIQFMTRDGLAEKAINDNMPLLKDVIMTTLSRSNADALRQVEEREALRNRVLKKVQSVMENETGDPSIERVLFTGFVIQ